MSKILELRYSLSKFTQPLSGDWAGGGGLDAAEGEAAHLGHARPLRHAVRHHLKKHDSGEKAMGIR